MYRGTQPFKYTVSTATLKLKPAVFEQPKLQMYAHDAMIFVSEFPSKATSELRAVWPWPYVILVRKLLCVLYENLVVCSVFITFD